jgi:hypothetical protein
MNKRPGQGAKPKPKPQVINVGSIVKAPITPDGGSPKPRPCVVLSTNSPDPAAPYFVIGVTTDNGRYDPLNAAKYDPELYIPMPYAPDGSAPTGFREPCAAKATWAQPFPASQLEVMEGKFLPPAELDALILKLKAFLQKRRAAKPT